MKSIVVYHENIDGMASALITKAALEKMGYDVSMVGIRDYSKLLIMKRMRTNNADLYVFLDIPSTFGTMINAYFRGKKIWFFDHHNRYHEEKPNAEVYMNPTEKKKHSIAYATTSAIVFRYFRDKGLIDDKYSVIALLGVYADLADFAFEKLYNLNKATAEIALDKRLIEYKVSWTAKYKYGLSIADVIDTNIYPVPKANFPSIIPREYHNKNWFNVDRKELFNILEDVYERPKYAIRATPHINGMEIHDLLGMISSCPGVSRKMNLMNFILGGYTPRQIILPRSIFRGSKVPLPNSIVEKKKYYFIDYDLSFSAGTYSSAIATRYIKDKPVIMLYRRGGITRVVGRAHSEIQNKYDVANIIYSRLKKVPHSFGGGHRGAGSGFSWKNKKVVKNVFVGHS